MENNSKEKMWGKRIEEMRDSKKHQKEWCEEKGISFSTLKYWMQKFSTKATSLDEQGNSKKGKWVKVDIKPESVFVPQSTDRIEVHIGSCRVVIPKNFSKESLTHIVEVLTKTC